MTKSPKSYDSMAAAAAAEGVSVELLRRAKKLGCSAFRGSRVYIDGLQKFIADHAAELSSGSGSLKEDKLKEEIRKLRIANDEKQGMLVEKEKIAATIRTILSKSSSVMEAALVNEYPSRVIGLEVAQVRELGRQIYDRVMVDLRALGKEFGE